MIGQAVKDRYYGVLEAYVAGREEEQLAAAAELGRELVLAGIPPEEVGELHQQALHRLAAESPSLTLQDTSLSTSMPLMELLMAYGLQYRSRTQDLEREVAERKQAEEDLQGKTILNQVLLDGFPCVALLLRPRTREIVASNEAAVSIGAVPGAKCYATWGRREEPCPWCLAPKAWDSGEAQHVEFESLGAVWDAYWIPVSKDMYMHYAFDITERRQAEAALRDSEEGLRLILDNARDAVFWADADTGLIIKCNKAGESLLEKEESEIIGHSQATLHPPQKAGYYMELFGRHIQAGGVIDEEAEVATKSGRIVPVLISASITSVRGQRIIQGIFRDITERKVAEEELVKHRDRLEELVEERTKELRDAQEELLRKERLAFLGELAGGVGHELRNPLGAIKNVAYYLRMVLKQPEPRVAESLNQMDRAVTRADVIISSLLSFAGQRPPTFRSGNVNDAAREALSQVEVPENVQVATQLDDTLPQISADHGQLGRVFENLIVNAVQAMVDGGRLTVRSECSGAGWVAVSIADTGVGLSAEDLAKVFQPLFTTRSRGIGLGLAISKTIVEAHGGSIEAQSKLGAGSTFVVRLPARSEEEREAGERLEPGATRGSEPGLSGDGDSALSL